MSWMAAAGSPTGRLLGTLSARGPDPEATDHLGALLQELDDHGSLVRTAVQERLAPLLWASVARAGLVEALDPDAARQLRRCYRRTALANVRRAADVEELLAGAGERAVRPVLLKGVVLVESLYGDPGRRPMSDVDLWLSVAERDRLIRWFEETGYCQDSLYPDTWRRGSLTLDLHTSLLGDRIGSRRTLLAAGEERIRRRLRPIDYRGLPAWRLGRYDEVLYLMLHLLKHNAERLVWLVDVDGLVDGWGGADAEALRETAREMGQGAALRQVAFLADRLLRRRPGSVLSRLAASDRPGWLDRRVLSRRGRGRPLPSWAPLLLFGPRTGPGARTRHLLETLFPRPEILRQTLRDAEDLRPWQLYWRRFFQLIERAVR